MKSLRETHPEAGFARAPVDVQRYCDGRSQVVCATTAEADISSAMPPDNKCMVKMMQFLEEESKLSGKGDLERCDELIQVNRSAL